MISKVYKTCKTKKLSVNICNFASMQSRLVAIFVFFAIGCANLSAQSELKPVSSQERVAENRYPAVVVGNDTIPRLRCVRFIVFRLINQNKRRSSIIGEQC